MTTTTEDKIMMNTNTKVYKANLDKYIDSCIEMEDNPNAALKEKVDYFMSEFNRVANYPHNINRYPNTIDRMDDYMLGLPFGFDFSNYDKLRVVAELHEVDSVPTDKEDVIIDRFNKHIAMRIVKLSEG